MLGVYVGGGGRLKIKLLDNLPLDSKHGMTKGRILEVEKYVNPRDTPRGSVTYWVRGDTGERVGVLYNEADEC